MNIEDLELKKISLNKEDVLIVSIKDKTKISEFGNIIRLKDELESAFPNNPVIVKFPGTELCIVNDKSKVMLEDIKEEPIDGQIS